jgi:hypothetical protein
MTNTDALPFNELPNLDLVDDGIEIADELAAAMADMIVVVLNSKLSTDERVEFAEQFAGLAERLAALAVRTRG